MLLPSCPVLSLLGLPVFGHQRPVPESLRTGQKTGLGDHSWIAKLHFQMCSIFLEILGG